MWWKSRKNRPKRKKRKLVRKAMVFCVALGLTLPSLLFSLNVIDLFIPAYRELLSADASLALEKANRYPVLDYIKQHVKKDDVVLVFRDSEFAYYLDHKMMVHPLPELLDLYVADHKEDVYAMLRARGVDYIYVIDKMEPPFFNSPIAQVVADPTMTELMAQDTFYGLFRVLPERADFRATDLEVPLITPADLANNRAQPEFWSVFTRNWTLHRPTRADYASKTGLAWGIERDRDGLPSIHLDYKGSLFYEYTGLAEVALVSGLGNYFFPPSDAFYEARLIPNDYYRFTAEVRGEGQLRAFVVQYANSRNFRKYRIWDSTLHEDYTTISAVFQAASFAEEYRLAIALPQRGDLWVRSVQLEHLDVEPVSDFRDSRALPTIPPKRYTWEDVLSEDLEDEDPAALANLFSFPWARTEPALLELTGESTSGRYSLAYRPSGEAGPALSVRDRAWITRLFLSKSAREEVRRSKLSLEYSPVRVSLRKLYWWLSVAMLGQKEDLHRFTASLKGRGYLDVYALYADKNERTQVVHMGQFLLAGDFRQVARTFEAPAGAHDFKPLFIFGPPQTEEEAALERYLVLDNMKIERGVEVASVETADAAQRKDE